MRRMVQALVKDGDDARDPVAVVWVNAALCFQCFEVLGFCRRLLEGGR